MVDGNCWDSADPALISPDPWSLTSANQRPVLGPISHKDTIKEPGELQVSKVEHHLFTQFSHDGVYSHNRDNSYQE